MLCSLAAIDEHGITLSQLGKIVERYWQEIPAHFPSVNLDAHVIMPNHLHGIIELRYIPQNNSPDLCSFRTVMTAFKGACTRTWGHLCDTSTRSIWQRSYYERIIRNESELLKFRTYILQNPIKWHLDKLNPSWRF
jgi:REP element-mobilizing transposase RayT